MGGIGAIGAILARRMPVRINHRTLQGIILSLQPLPLSVLRNQGSTMVATHMEGKLIGIGSVCRMTIETGTRCCGILKDCRFLKVTQVALIDAQLAIHLITRGNTTISKSPVVQLVWADIYIEVLILEPFTIFQYKHRDGEFSALIFSQEVVPLLYIKVRILFSERRDFLDGLRSCHTHCHFIYIVIRHIEIKRSDVDRNCNPDVIREDFRQLFDFFCLTPW